jgi:hypothetical protein
VADENRRGSTGNAGAPRPDPPPAQQTGVQVAFGEDFKPYYDWSKGSIRFMTNVPCSGTFEIGTRKPVEANGLSKASGVTRVARFSDAGNAHMVVLSAASLPEAKVYYWVITINANGTTDQMTGEIYRPVLIDGR